MCEGLGAIAVKQADGSWKGYAKPQNGSHGLLFSENCPDCHDQALRFEIFYPGTIQWNRPDATALETLQKNGIVGTEGLGKIPLASVDAIEAIISALKGIDASWWTLTMLQRADLQGADLRGAYLWGAYLWEADLRGADLRGAYLQGAYLRGADLRGAYLQGAYLRGADLQEADLRGADLQEAYLQEAYLRGADLRGADLQGADLWEARLVGQDKDDLGKRGAKVNPA